MVDVSFVLRNKAVRAGAAQWLDELPALVAGLEQEWSIRVGRPYGDATEAFVAEAVLEDGTPAALKLVDPDGLLAEAEYDLGILMREDPIELLDDCDPRARARWLAARTGLDVEAIWEWGSSSGCPPGCCAPRSACSRWDTRCSPSPRCSPRREELLSRRAARRATRAARCR